MQLSEENRVPATGVGRRQTQGFPLDNQNTFGKLPPPLFSALLSCAVLAKLPTLEPLRTSEQ